MFEFLSTLQCLNDDKCYAIMQHLVECNCFDLVQKEINLLQIMSDTLDFLTIVEFRCLNNCSASVRVRAY